MKIYTFYNGHHIDKDTFNQIVEKLSMEGFDPVIYNWSKQISKKIGKVFDVDFYNRILYLEQNEGIYKIDDLMVAEAFIRDEDIFLWFYQSEFYDELFPYSYIKSGMTICKLSNKTTENDYNLADFIRIVSDECIKSSHFTRYLDSYELKELKAWTIHSEKEIFVSKDGYEYSETLIKEFKEVDYTHEDVELSQLFIDSKIKNLILLIAKNVKIRKDDVVDKLGRYNAVNHIKVLQDKNSIHVEKLIHCSESKQDLITITNESLIDENILLSQKCSICNKLFENEEITEVYSLKPSLIKLLTSSHWMTVLVTELLIQCGVDKQRIIWGLLDKSDEIDIAFVYKNRFHVVELKDGDFEVGHAYALNYRSKKFEADQIIIVTTGKVSSEAKTLFLNVHDKEIEQDAMIEDDFFRKNRTLPIYIENFSGSHRSLEGFVVASNKYEVEDVLQRFKRITNIDLSFLLFGNDE